MRILFSLKVFSQAVFCLAVACAVGHSFAQGQEAASPSAAAERISVSYDEASQTTRIALRAKDGRVAWSDIWDGIAIARGKAAATGQDAAAEKPSSEPTAEPSKETSPGDAAVGGMRSINLRSPTARASLTALSMALSPDVKFAMVPAEKDGEEQLVVTMSRDAVMSSERRLKERMRQSLVSRVRWREAEQSPFQLTLDDGWSERPKELPLVIAVHGLFSKSDRVERLLELPRKAGFPCGEYSYSSRRPIPELAVQFAEQLDRIRREHPERKVAVIAHSMGGLVVRAAIEDPALDPGNVVRLIMLATPNQGSRLADFNFALGVSNYVADAERRESVRLFSALAEDTLGASSYDLRPDSEFLARLNARARNANVAYTIILGSGAWLSVGERDRMATLLGASEEEGRFLRLLRGNVNKLLADLDEVVKGRGDGAVSVERGKLTGVEDVVVLPFGHSEIIGGSDNEAVVQAHKEAMARLLPSGQ